MHSRRKQKTKKDNKSSKQTSSPSNKSNKSSADSQSTNDILNLQNTLGNQAVQRLIEGGQLNPDGAVAGQIQRALTPEEKAMNLTSPRFAGNTRLEAAYDNSPPMRRPLTHPAVGIVQQALIDLGYPMPISTAKTGEPDEIYGKETKEKVKKFQGDHDLDDDGVVGRQTMGKLDELFGGSTPESKPEIDATEEATGQHIVDEVNRSNENRGVNAGIWYAHNYKDEYINHKDEHDDWKVAWTDDLEFGYADPKYFVRLGFMHWKLKPGVSASEAIKSWLEGLTIAECLTAIIAIETDTMRASIGDAKFDELFGSKDKPPSLGLLEISINSSSVDAFMKASDSLEAGESAGSIGKRPVEKGEWYYFYNHPKYLLKHPAGAFQGENAIYMGDNEAGEQLWAGLGVPPTSEMGMLEEMSEAYNAERDSADYRAILVRHGIAIPDGTPESQYEQLYMDNLDKIDDKYRHDRGEYPTSDITPKDILDAEEYELDGTKRKGGFVHDAGQELDLEKIKKLRSS